VAISRESVMIRNPGVAMTEYVLILAAFARVLFGSYLVLGREVSSLVSGLDSALTAATNRAAASQSTPQP